MTQIKVKLIHEDCALIERLFYEYNASKDIICFLMQQDSVNETYLQQYINIAEKRFTELEMNKKAVDKHYRPEGIGAANYEFDFENEELIYTIED